MRVVYTTALVLALSAAAAVPAFAQTAAPATTDPSTASVDFNALRESLTVTNKSLNADLATQRQIVKKNQDLLKEAQKLDADNKKLVAEKQKLAQQNADLEKQRAALASAQPTAPSAPQNASTSETPAPASTPSISSVKPANPVTVAAR